ACACPGPCRKRQGQQAKPGEPGCGRRPPSLQEEDASETRATLRELGAASAPMRIMLQSPSSEAVVSTPTEPAGPSKDQPTLAHPGAPREEAVPPGERVGDFVLLGELGRGGMGVVYKAFEPELGRHVAVKMILSGAVSSADDLRRFQAEAGAAARLQ